MKKALVIRPFKYMGVEYKMDDTLFIMNSSYGVDLVFSKDIKYSICEVNSIFFKEYLQILDTKIK